MVWSTASSSSSSAPTRNASFNSLTAQSASMPTALDLASVFSKLSSNVSREPSICSCPSAQSRAAPTCCSYLLLLPAPPAAESASLSSSAGTAGTDAATTGTGCMRSTVQVTTGTPGHKTQSVSPLSLRFLAQERQYQCLRGTTRTSTARSQQLRRPTSHPAATRPVAYEPNGGAPAHASNRVRAARRKHRRELLPTDWTCAISEHSGTVSRQNRMAPFIHRAHGQRSSACSVAQWRSMCSDRRCANRFANGL
jgi:hypothetical protein